MTRLGVWYDFRNPARWRVPWPQLYRETLDQAAYAEELGFASVWLSEHHFSDEGYLPSLTAVLGALAERTSRPGSAPRSCSPRCTTRCGWPRTWPWSTSCPAAGSTWGSRPATSRTSSRCSACPRASAARAPTRPSRSCSWPGGASRSRTRASTSGSTTWWSAPPPVQQAGPADLGRRQQPGRGPPGGPVRRVLHAGLRGRPGRSTTRTGTSWPGPGRPGWRPTGCCSRRRAGRRPGRSAATHFLYQFNAYREWFSAAGDDDSHGDELDRPVGAESRSTTSSARRTTSWPPSPRASTGSATRSWSSGPGRRACRSSWRPLAGAVRPARAPRPDHEAGR